MHPPPLPHPLADLPTTTPHRTTQHHTATHRTAPRRSTQHHTTPHHTTHHHSATRTYIIMHTTRRLHNHSTTISLRATPITVSCLIRLLRVLRALPFAGCTPWTKPRRMRLRRRTRSTFVGSETCALPFACAVVLYCTAVTRFRDVRVQLSCIVSRSGAACGGTRRLLRIRIVQGGV
jgi:hypothetical protein